MPYHNPLRRARLHTRQLKGTIIPTKPPAVAASYDISEWYQTTIETPFLYLPPVAHTQQLENGVIIPVASCDVLIAVTTPSNDRKVLTGWFSYSAYEWQYTAVDPRAYADYAPHYWRFMPVLPYGWVDVPDRSNNDVR